eukprot:196071_1
MSKNSADYHYQPPSDNMRRTSNHHQKAYLAKSQFATLPPKVIISFLLLFLVYLAITSILYSAVEGWSLIDSLYFAIITISTVGFGDIAPETVLGKVINMVFILGSFFGVFVLFRVVLGYLVDHQIAAIIQRIKHKKKKDQSSRWTFGLNTAKTTENLDALADQAQEDIREEEDKEIHEGTNVQWIMHLLLYFLWLVMWTLFFTLFKEESISFFNALYFGIVTSSTIGYGAYVPVSDGGKLFCVITTMFGVLFLAILAGSVSQGVMAFIRSMFKKKGTAANPREEYEVQLESILEIAKSGKGKVDRFDFVMEMLIAQKKCKKREIKKLCAAFDDLDVNDDGVLDELDFQEALEKQITMMGGDVDFNDDQ